MEDHLTWSPISSGRSVPLLMIVAAVFVDVVVLDVAVVAVVAVVVVVVTVIMFVTVLWEGGVVVDGWIACCSGFVGMTM